MVFFTQTRTSMHGDIFSQALVKRSASEAEPQRINLNDRKLISVVVQNTSQSAQNLWVGVNAEEALLPLGPGESLPFASRENSYLRGFLTLRWDNQADDRYGIIIYGMDSGDVKDC